MESVCLRTVAAAEVEKAPQDGAAIDVVTKAVDDVVKLCHRAVV